MCVGTVLVSVKSYTMFICIALSDCILRKMFVSVQNLAVSRHYVYLSCRLYPDMNDCVCPDLTLKYTMFTRVVD